MPPESSRGCGRGSARPTRSMSCVGACSIRLPRLALGVDREQHVLHRRPPWKQRGLLEHRIPDMSRGAVSLLPPMWMAPVVGIDNPGEHPEQRRLLQPPRSTSAMNSPGRICRSTSASACTARGPVPNTFETRSISTRPTSPVNRRAYPPEPPAVLTMPPRSISSPHAACTRTSLASPSTAGTSPSEERPRCAGCRSGRRTRRSRHTSASPRPSPCPRSRR